MRTLDPLRGIAAVALVLAFAVLAVPGSAVAAPSPVKPVNADDGLALKGYDPVAYFTTGRPTPGREQFTHRYRGAAYRFASAENRDRFAAAPEAYAPQYGGYCAYAISINRIADIDPARWAIVDGKLYLNNNRLSHLLWSANKPGHIRSGDRYWAEFPKAADAE